jgi:hypothetical protein
MTSIPDSPDLAAIADEAQVEIEYAETLQAADVTLGDASLVFATAELGYYEAELTSLRDAARTLGAAEQHSE